MNLKKNEITNPNFFELSDEILEFWKKNNIFEKSVEIRSSDNPYRFYDGPPFITGIPHYGSLLPSICKDIVPRYWTMKGKKCERVWGWDCHGIPIEDKVMKKLGINSNKEIEKVGIKKFIEECYNYTRVTSAEWKWYVDHIGRWVDFDNSYKTMDQKYMESVIWIFKQFYDKGFIYKGKRISLYSVKLGTPISNFEVSMDDSYLDANDPAVTIIFDISKNGGVWNGVKILAWTTTPRTLPTNMALAVNNNFDYCLIELNGIKYIVAKNRVEYVFKGNQINILDEFKGEKLVGLSYEPIFSFYNKIVDFDKNYKIYHAEFITDTDGTGIGHQAPEFGEVDFQLGKQYGLFQTESIDEECRYNSQIPDYEGIYVRDANDLIIQRLKQEGKLFKKENITHRVPVCPRTQIPLIYRTQDAWFMNIQDIKDKLLKENENIYWFPNHLKHGRFAKNIEVAPDWCLSRTRYWATPMPIWKCSCGNIKVVGSIQEIEQLSGQKVMDLHRPFIDEFFFKCEKCSGIMKREKEVLDVWLESGSMSFAQFHYPFENKEKFEKAYPADFIVEYVGQIRAWFYVLHVVGVSLFGQNCFKNVITTGVISGNDGRKMSKSFNNFTDPKKLIEQYGGDAIRMYLVTTPLLSGGDINFSDEGVKEALKKVILPYWNTYYFFSTYAIIDNFQPTYFSIDQIKELNFENRLDRWIISALNKLIIQVEDGLSKYDLQSSSRPILEFMDNLTNWYIRRSRRRFWKSENDNDKLDGYNTLYVVLVELSKILAPFIPFVSEYIFKKLTDLESVHLEFYPISDNKLIDEQLNENMNRVQNIINLGLAWRSSRKIRVRQPLKTLYLSYKLDEYYQNIIKEELNIKNIVFVEPTSLCKKIIKSNAKLLGPKYGSDVQKIIVAGKNGDFTELGDGKIRIFDFILEKDEFELSYLKTDDNYDVEIGFDLVIAIDSEIDENLLIEGYARDLIRFIQEARKEAGYNIEDKIRLQVLGEHSFINIFGQYIESETLSKLTDLSEFDLEKKVEIGELFVVFRLFKN